MNQERRRAQFVRELNSLKRRFEKLGLSDEETFGLAMGALTEMAVRDWGRDAAVSTLLAIAEINKAPPAEGP